MLFVGCADNNEDNDIQWDREQLYQMIAIEQFVLLYLGENSKKIFQKRTVMMSMSKLNEHR